MCILTKIFQFGIQLSPFSTQEGAHPTTKGSARKHLLVNAIFDAKYEKYEVSFLDSSIVYHLIITIWIDQNNELVIFIKKSLACLSKPRFAFKSYNDYI